MLKLYKNKLQTFECSIEIEGSSESSAKPRLILSPDNDSKSLFFEGNIHDGECTIDVYPNVNIGNIGKVTLEVIIDESTLFKPWSSTYKIITDQVKIQEAHISYGNKSKIGPTVTVRNIVEEKEAPKPVPVRSKPVEKKQVVKKTKTDILEQMASMIDDKPDLIDFKDNTSKIDKEVVNEYILSFGKIQKEQRKMLLHHIKKDYNPEFNTKIWGKRIFKDSNLITSKIAMYCKENIK